MTMHVVVIVGPTATGKTRLGVEIAHRLGSEIISADSRQVYRGLDIGTGKDLGEYHAVTPPVPYHLIDVVDPIRVYSLFSFQRDCFRVLKNAAASRPFVDGVPILMVGGSGLYIEAVIRGYRLADVPENSELRRRLADVSRDELEARLRRDDPEIMARTDPSSAKRLIRGLEIAAAARRGPVAWSEPLDIDVRWSVVGVLVAREVIHRRIADRLDARLAEGMVEEVKGLLTAGVPRAKLEMLGLEYREIAAHLAGEKDLTTMRHDLGAAIRRFAKRQMTWFRGMPRRGIPVTWVGPRDVERVFTIATGPL